MLAACVIVLAASARARAPVWRSALAAPRGAVRCSTGASPLVERLDAWMAATGRDETPVAVSNADTVSRALSDFWAQVCTTADSPFRERALALPFLDADARAFSRLMAHINTCSEVCETLGSELFVALRHPGGTSGDEPPVPCPMLLLRKTAGAGASESESDPYWDEDDDDWPEESALEGVGAGGTAAVDNKQVLLETRSWVEAVICHMGVCPFSNSADRAGLPQGGVSYPITKTRVADEIYLEFWHQVQLLDQTDERLLSTTLLITPDFMAQSPGGFDQFADTLNEVAAFCNKSSFNASSVAAPVWGIWAWRLYSDG
ncbi:hypothetical protein T492DRAFT_1080108 [Pavlovales sp. CCMP2436]|nr:hypothetical protein T492DRAFT_1080108 [Pavlovales sp. CCMP2436]